MGMAIGGTIILIGASIISAAQDIGMFLGGRFVLGFGIAISTTAAPMWVTELAPAHWRGRLGAAYNSEFFPLVSLGPSYAALVARDANVTALRVWSSRLALTGCFFVGAIPATGIMVRTETFNSTWAWRLPLLIQVRLRARPRRDLRC